MKHITPTPLHQNADWELSDNEGNVVAESHGTLSLNMEEGLQKPGIYTLRVKGTENPADGTACETTREFPGFVQGFRCLPTAPYHQ